MSGRISFVSSLGRRLVQRRVEAVPDLLDIHMVHLLR
jgi:hypothetical protein